MSAARARGDGGAVLVEVALILPVLLFLAMGMTEYSVAEFQSSQASSAARDGARVGILDYRAADVVGSPANQQVVAAVHARLAGQDDVDVAVSCLDETGSVIVCADAVAERDRLQVAVSWPYDAVTGVVTVTPTTISSTSRMALVGQVLSTSTTVSPSSSTTSSSSTSTSSTTSSSTSSTTTTVGACVVSDLSADNGSGGELPAVNNGGKLAQSLHIYFAAQGSTCGDFVVTVWPTGDGGASGTPYSAPNGVSFTAGQGRYTAIYNKTDRGIAWQPGDVLIRVSSTDGPLGGVTDLTVTLDAK